MVRYADDLVVGFEHRVEAERFLREFQKRLTKFALEVHPEKMQWIEFGRFADQPEAARCGQAGDIRVSRIHPLLWDESERPFCRSAANRGEADKGEVAAVEAGVAPEDARAGERGERMAEAGCGGLLLVSRCAGEHRCAGTISGPAL